MPQTSKIPNYYMNSYEKIYNILIEAHTDWSEYKDTGEFQKFPQKTKLRKHTKPGIARKQQRIRPQYDTSVTQAIISQAAKEDAVIKARGRTTK